VQIRPQFFLVIVVTDRQTDRQTHTLTNAGENIFPCCRGDNKRCCKIRYYASVTFKFLLIIDFKTAVLVNF